MLDGFFVENHMFRAFTWPHGLVLLLGFLSFALLIKIARRSTPEQKVRYGAILSYTILITYFLVFVAIDAARFGFDPKN